MIYRSNLTAPDLQPYFEPLLCKVRHNTMGHDALSDPDFEPDCQFFTHDEAAILYNVAQSVEGDWIDIGSRMGWTSAHIAKPDRRVVCIDPEYKNSEFRQRFLKNTNDFRPLWYGATTFEFFKWYQRKFDGACIDGNHDAPFPLVDATLCAVAGARVIVFHDFWGSPIQDAVTWLMNNGFSARIYNTPNGVAVCWRGEFSPPDHTPDPAIDWTVVRRRAAGFDFTRTL